MLFPQGFHCTGMPIKVPQLFLLTTVIVSLCRVELVAVKSHWLLIPCGNHQLDLVCRSSLSLHHLDCSSMFTTSWILSSPHTCPYVTLVSSMCTTSWYLVCSSSLSLFHCDLSSILVCFSVYCCNGCHAADWQLWYVGVLQQGSSLQEVIVFSKTGVCDAAGLC